MKFGQIIVLLALLTVPLAQFAQEETIRPINLSNCIPSLVNAGPDTMFVGTFFGTLISMAVISHVHKPQISTISNLVDEIPLAMTLATVLSTLISATAWITPDVECTNPVSNPATAAIISGAAATIMSLVFTHSENQPQLLKVLPGILASMPAAWGAQTLVEALKSQVRTLLAKQADASTEYHEL